MVVAAGMRLGPYEILGPLGAGGMGEVYRAIDTRLDRTVALKVLPQDFLESEERKRRFEKEAKLLAALNHPNIAVLYSFEEIEGRHVLTMELLEGESLREVLLRRTPTTRQVLSWALQAAQGLAAAHQKGIVHRDIKPENLFLTSDGRIKILDAAHVHERASRARPEGAERVEARARAASRLADRAALVRVSARGAPIRASGRTLPDDHDQPGALSASLSAHLNSPVIHLNHGVARDA